MNLSERKRGHDQIELASIMTYNGHWPLHLITIHHPPSASIVIPYFHFTFIQQQTQDDLPSLPHPRCAHQQPPPHHLSSLQLNINTSRRLHSRILRHQKVHPNQLSCPRHRRRLPQVHDGAPSESPHDQHKLHNCQRDACCRS